MATSLLDSISTTGDITVGTDGSGNMITGPGNSTLAVFNTIATTVSAFGAATSLSLGNSVGTNTVLGLSKFIEASGEGDASLHARTIAHFQSNSTTGANAYISIAGGSGTGEVGIFFGDKDDQDDDE